MDKHSTTSEQPLRVKVACAAVKWARNTEAIETRTQFSVKVLGCRISQSLSRPSHVARHCDASSAFTRRVAIMAGRERDTTALKYSGAIACALTAKPQGDGPKPLDIRLSVGDHLLARRSQEDDGKGGALARVCNLGWRRGEPRVEKPQRPTD